MLFGRYGFTCRLETDAELPPYKGSTFRGVFGRALKKVVCALRQQECDECILKTKCIYTLVFETPASEETRDSRIVSPPHPFVIEPPLTDKSYYPAGELFDFSLLLMGEANNFLPYFIYAFEQMGEIGIGKKINNRRGRFLLDQVQCGGSVIYTSSCRKLTNHGTSEKLLLHIPENNQDKSLQLKLILETPLRLKFNNKLQAILPFHVLIRSMLRRVSSLMNAYGEGEPDLDYRGLIQRAEKIQMADNHLSWYDWQRYSFRQEAKMLMGGMNGSVTYEGDIGEYLPIVEFCKQVHIGKQTTFGLGKFKPELLS